MLSSGKISTATVFHGMWLLFVKSSGVCVCVCAFFSVSACVWIQLRVIKTPVRAMRQHSGTINTSHPCCWRHKHKTIHTILSALITTEAHSIPRGEDELTVCEWVSVHECLQVTDHWLLLGAGVVWPQESEQNPSPLCPSLFIAPSPFSLLPSHLCSCMTIRSLQLC